MRFFLISLVLCSLSSCAIREDEKARRVVPPKGSDDSSMPWNVPQEGEGQGVLGGLIRR